MLDLHVRKQVEKIPDSIISSRSYLAKGVKDPALSLLWLGFDPWFGHSQNEKKKDERQGGVRGT